MNEALSPLAVVTLWIAVAWVVALFGQLMDVVNSVIELGLAKDTPLQTRAERRRLTDSVWSIVGVSLLAVGVLVGVDIAVRLIFDWNQIAEGIWLIVGLIFAVLVAGFGIVVAMIRGDGLSYAVLRANLAEDAGERIKAEQVKLFRNQLAQIDERKRHIRFGLRDKARLRPVRVRLEIIADEFAVVPPTGFGAVQQVRWRTANAYLWRGNPIRLVPAIVAVVVTVASFIAVSWAFGLVGIVAVALSFFLALVEARFALAAKAAWHAVYQKQRVDAITLIESLERSSRKGVAGLGDRVARALQILRDQQN